MDRFGTGFVAQAESGLVCRTRRTVISRRGIQKPVACVDGARAARARWGYQQLENSREMRRESMPLRGIDFLSEPFDLCHRQTLLRQARSEDELKLRPTKIGTRIAWRGRLERPGV
jgi:hypothetical protein